MSTLKVDSLVEKTSGNGVHIAGHVVQVVNSVHNTSSVTDSTSYVDTGLSATITPKFSNSKILVEVYVSSMGGQSANIGFVQLQRNNSGITAMQNASGGIGQTNSATVVIGGNMSTNNNRQSDTIALSYLDSPASNSAQTYKLVMKQNSGGGNTAFNRWYLNTDKASVANITLQEIAQ